MSTPIPKNRAAFTTEEARAATGATLAHSSAAAARHAGGVTTDSRAVAKGGVFVALRGERFDGHAFLEHAVVAGATLLVVDDAARVPASASAAADVLVVTDTLEAWGALGRAHRRRWGGRLVAITGSAGKTTTKEICAALLGALAPTLATTGNLNNRVGVPATLFCLEASHRYAVIEAGMSVRGEIAALTSIAEPDVAVVTNVGVAHAEGVGGTRADVMREKHAIFVRPRVVAVGNADDGLTLPVGAVTFGASNGADYRLVARPSVDASGSICEIAAPGGRALRLHLPIPGHAAAIDLTAALAAAEGAVGPIDPVVVAAALASLAVPHGRGEVRRRSDGMVVLDDTYNANPSSVRAALATLRELAVAESRRAVAVLGEMKELGAASRDLHAAMGDDVAAARVSLVIGCGGLVDLALDRAAAAGVETAKGRDVAEASALARTRVGPNDIVLVKGSRSVGTECIVEELLRAP